MQRALFVGTLYLMAIVLMYSCSAIPIREGAAIEIVNEKPQGNCKMLGEVVGSQGSWITGSWTSNKNLMAGARNDLRNQAAAMGGNVVYVQSSSRAVGEKNTTLFGTVYRCQ